MALLQYQDMAPTDGWETKPFLAGQENGHDEMDTSKDKNISRQKRMLNARTILSVVNLVVLVLNLAFLVYLTSRSDYCKDDMKRIVFEKAFCEWMKQPHQLLNSIINSIIH